ncbi:MAG: CatA-like O-acetyltransferase [Thomasclavelia sp.]|uniref:CatA-like O-acetyltransferase n=1 Tax=Thomasclavelia sp. TaxID=3025757 RepID=UPI00399F7685
MNYKKVGLNKWKRGNLFKYYIDNMRIVMSLTVDIDVAPLLYIQKTQFEILSGNDMGSINNY